MKRGLNTDRETEYPNGMELIRISNYLKATGHRLGLPVNLGNYPNLEWERKEVRHG